MYNELFLSIGADLTANEVIAALSNTIQHIEEHGLYIGRSEQQGPEFLETLDGEIKLYRWYRSRFPAEPER